MNDDYRDMFAGLDAAGAEFDEVWADKIEITADGRRLFVIGREALIKNKLATGRDKDLLDVRALRSSEP